MPRDQVTVLDDWGDGVTLGMSSSGSNGVRVDGVFVPARRTALSNWTRVTEPAPGMRWHGNPLYCGRIYAVYHAGLPRRPSWPGCTSACPTACSSAGP